MRQEHDMSITIRPELEQTLRIRAEAAGLTADVYLERLIRADQEAQDELEALALEGINSGEPREAGPGFWEEERRMLDKRLA
jgi:hypothetical protein